MSSKVLFLRAGSDESPESLAEKALRLFEAADVDLDICEGRLVAIKQHFGEGKGTGFIKPPVARAFVEMIKSQGAKPFLTETATLYRGQRSNAVDHLTLAYRHGFTPEAVGCPIVMADGLLGAGQVKVRIDRKHYKEVLVAHDVPHIHAMIVLTHVTGHPAIGFGGSIKNLGMGLSSRAGKLDQHHGAAPLADEEKCTACGKCAKWCPADAITVDDNAVIDEEACIGCGECLAVCPFGAVGFKWQALTVDLHEKVAEHALGVATALAGRIVYINFAVGITRGCDCFDVIQDPFIDDIGILLSDDPVALDVATLELINRDNGRDVLREEFPDIDSTVQITYGEEIGLGNSDYELVEIK